MKYLLLKNDAVNVDKWAQFVHEHPYGNIFQSPEIYEVYKKSNFHTPFCFCLINQAGDIYAIFSGVIIWNYGNLLYPFTSRAIIQGGPILKEESHELLDELLIIFKKEIKTEVVYSQIRNLRDWSHMRNVFEKHGFCYEKHLDIIHDLEIGENSLWANISGKARSKINKANRNNLLFKEINTEKEISNAYEILVNVYKNAHLPYPKKDLFKNALLVLAPKNYLKCFGAFYNDILIGFRFELCYRNNLYDWYAGSNKAYYKFQPNDFLPWKIMVWGIENGYKKFDFGGAGKPGIPYGVREYKLKFAGKLIENGRFEIIHKKLIYFFGKKGLKLWRHIKRTG